MVKLADPERLDWRYGFFDLGLPGERPVESLRPFEDWCAETTATSDFSRLSAIFHVSRCGSTLLSQNLKHTGRAIVLSEPPFLRILRGRIHDTVSPETALRAVARALAEWLIWAEAQGKRLIVKFHSQVHILREALMTALPGARFLFLHREPAAVLESIMRGPPPYLERESGRDRFALSPALADIADEPILLAAANRYCAALDAFATHTDNCPHIAYPELAQKFGEICDHFGVGPVSPSSWQAHRNAKSFNPGSREVYHPVGEERLAAFASQHPDVLAVASARYKSFIDLAGA